MRGSARLLPAQMATAASREHVDKSTALGICSSIASATQLLQPPVGALADVANGRYRKVWLAFGQLICAVGCIGLLVGSSTMQLSVAMTVCMLGSSIGWGVYLCIIPDYVPEAQHGVASGIQGFMAIAGAWPFHPQIQSPEVLQENCVCLVDVAGTISGSAIGYAHGNGWLSSSYVYWFCAIINVLVGVFGWVALSGQRNHREIFPDTSVPGNISRTIINAQHWRDSGADASQALRRSEKLVGRTRVARSFRASDTLPSLHCLWQLRSRLSVQCSWGRSCSTYRCVAL